MTARRQSSHTDSGEAFQALHPAQHQVLSTIVGMASGDQKQVKRSEGTQETSETRPASNMKEKGETLKEDLDRIIDEIDEVLEENAEEFVKNYVQRGGE